jgi:hypothetical protein
MQSVQTFYQVTHPDHKTEYIRRGSQFVKQILNGLDVPDRFHEAAEALIHTGNWNRHDDYEEITTKRLARSFSVFTGSSFKKVLQRLVKNLPKFYEWMRETETPLFLIRSGSLPKSPTQFKFPYYKQIKELMELPLETPQQEIRKRADKLCQEIKMRPEETQAKRSPRERSVESITDSAIRLLELKTETHSASIIATELLGSIERISKNPELIKTILRMASNVN